MKFYYRKISHLEKNVFPGIIYTVIRNMYEDSEQFEPFVIKNDLKNPVDLDRYEIYFEEMDRDRKILYDRILRVFNMLDRTPIVHVLDTVKVRKVFPGDRYRKITCCIFTSKNEVVSSLYKEGDTDKLFVRNNIFKITKDSHYKIPTSSKVGRPPKKNLFKTKK